MYKLNRFFILRKTLNRQKYLSTIVNGVEEPIKPWKKIPGPLSLPIIGQILHFLPGGWLHKRSIELQQLLYENYGPIVRLDGNLGFPPITFLFDPEAAITLFRKEESLPFRPGFESLVYHRKHFYNKNVDDSCGVLFELKSKRNKQNMIETNLFNELNLWALESTGLVTFGERLNCLDPNLSNNSPAMKLIKTQQESLCMIEKLDFQPSLWKYITTPAYKKGIKTFDDNLRYTWFFIDRAIQKLKSKEDTSDEIKGIFEKIFKIDRDVAVTLANDLILAGVDTSANTSLGILYHLAANLEKQNKLREEVLSKQTSTYLKACIKEGMRLYPVVGGNFRKTMKEHEVLGYRIPKNMVIILGNQYLCSVEDQFPQPSEFIPERWIVDKNNPLYYGNAHPFAYAPFGFGVRSCVGRRIADLQIEMLISKIVENFKLDWIGPPPKRTRRSTLNYILEPYNLVFNDI
ncbi:cytochrome P450 CYP12A2 isoform X2 [Bicyclus anynana]|uniref:Cytochrome P450 CYP12A2 isoform X2 n=1 Tax=Bicyclus anynana TaxID=110368 RepID=A0ABM3LFW3_BICAN|nr:cytochrome P450 CYP12A2 isoform X2 [Bicyclus anynana]